MSSRTQYVVTETVISAVINAVLSIGFVFLVFHGKTRIEAASAHGIIFDMAPQTFMVVLMSCLVPALLTRRRHSSGALAWHSQQLHPSVWPLWRRAVLLAVFATCLIVALNWAILPRLFPDGVGFVPLVVGKAIFGVLLAVTVTPWAVGKVLR